VAWDSHSVEWDSPLEQVGFILSQFLRWDFSVPEVNIYYYKLTESSGSLRIPAAASLKKKFAKILGGEGVMVAEGGTRETNIFDSS
jgi:hypothetical protein